MGEVYTCISEGGGPAYIGNTRDGWVQTDTSKAYFGLADYDNYRLKQLEWLKKEVQTEAFKKAAFRVVVIHMPVIERKDNWYGMAFLAKHYGPVLEMAGIDLMISSHTHENEWISADSSGFGYPVMIASNHNFTEFTVTDKQISIRLKDIKGRIVDEHNVYHSSWFSRALEFKGIAVEDKDYTIWGYAPVKGDDDKVHIFAARWPQKNVNPAWRKSSEIAHYVSDNPEGPYVITNEPITDNNATLEDATAFYYNDTFYLLTTDNHGKNTGVVGGGTLWGSKDGLMYHLKDAKVAYNRLPYYYPEYDRKKVTRIYGADPKIERPKILMIDGKPAYLYGAGGWNIYGGKRAVSYVFKINLD